jgi:MFS family permease
VAFSICRVQGYAAPPKTRCSRTPPASPALAALGSGWSYDRFGTKTLAALPVLSASVAVFGFTGNTWMLIVGALILAAAVGIPESTLRGLVADLVPAPRRASADGAFAAGLGAATAAGGGVFPIRLPGAASR